MNVYRIMPAHGRLLLPVPLHKRKAHTFMTEENQSSAVRKPNVKWRVVDIVVAAIVAVASGVIFWAWDFIYAVPTALFDSLTPGLGTLSISCGCSPGPARGHHHPASPEWPSSAKPRRGQSKRC